ncbi:hypothetical protein P8452_52651 [Trifolium repens]|nr:hypothetical protein P8452_52651 [Trifolium repens]
MQCFSKIIYIGGFQIFHQDKWIDYVPSIPEAFVINFGELLKLITNDRFQSVEQIALLQEYLLHLSSSVYAPSYNEPHHLLHCLYHF